MQQYCFGMCLDRTLGDNAQFTVGGFAGHRKSQEKMTMEMMPLTWTLRSNSSLWMISQKVMMLYSMIHDSTDTWCELGYGEQAYYILPADVLIQKCPKRPVTSCKAW